MTLRTKLALWYSVLVTVILIFLGGIRYAGQKQLLQDQKDYSLKVVASILDASLLPRTPSKATVQRAVARIIKDYPDIELRGTLIEVYDAFRSIVYSSSLSEAGQLPVTEEMWGKALRGEMSLVTIPTFHDAASLRVLTKPVLNREGLVYLVQVGRSMQEIESTLEDSLLINLLFIPVAVFLVGIGGWLLTKRALEPLNAVIQTAHRISSGALSHRIEVSQTSREIQDLANAFNQMIVRLEASFQKIRDFSDNVSHELRIPLSILKGQTELSLRRVRSIGDYREVLESNLEEIQRMEKIVDRLLFLSRADRGEISLNLAQVDLTGLAQSVSSQFLVPAQEKGIKITLDANGPSLMVGDELLLREVLLNLVQNAMTYTPEGGEIGLALARDNGQIRLSVSDTGCGIPENEIAHIFDRFYQVDKSRSSQGNGLGLSLCQWIVQAHQGKLHVESTLGMGSRFTVCLPVKD